MMAEYFQPKIDMWPEVKYDRITVEDKIAEIRLELNYRKGVYGRRVAEGNMTEKDAARRIAVMMSILQDYVDQIPDLFNQGG